MQISSLVQGANVTIPLARGQIASECVQQTASFDGVAITTQSGDAVYMNRALSPSLRAPRCCSAN